MFEQNMQFKNTQVDKTKLAYFLWKGRMTDALLIRRKMHCKSCCLTL